MWQDDMLKQELGDLIALRGDRFGAVSSVFARESSDAEVSQMISNAVAAADEDAEQKSSESILTRELAALATKVDSAFATLTRTEYARLFIGPRAVLVPLHESAYLSGTKRMFTSETLDVRRFFARFGYEMQHKNKEPEDSVAIELEFLRKLCDRCVAILSESIASDNVAAGSVISDATFDEVEQLLRVQGDFMEQHVFRWMGEFASQVIQHDRSGYYRAWARFLSSVLDEDSVLVDQCLARVARLRIAVS